MHIPSPHTSDLQQNQFLAALPESVGSRWRGQLEFVELPRDKHLCTAGTTPAHVYFPTTAMVSLMYLTQDGVSTEICPVGNDGVVGIDSLMGASTVHTLAVVQTAGHGYRMNARAMRQELAQGGPAVPILLHYAHKLVAQMAQTAVCNHFHSVEQKFCRRMLISLDHAPQNEVTLTHEQFSHLLGVRRESISVVANKLQRSGVIRYNRGHIHVIDRKRLETHACECYAATRKQIERPLPLLLAA